MNDEPESETSVDSEIERLRDIVNGYELPGDPPWREKWWGNVCAALDVIGDTQRAFAEYRALPSGSIGYLQLYGLLEALYIQQDAARELMKRFRVGGYPSDNPDLRRPRDVRDDVAGHPSDRRYGKEAIQLSRPEMTKEQIRLLRHTQGSSDVESKVVDLLPMMAGQEVCIAAALKLTADALDQRAENHRAEFSAQKLSDIFGANVAYARQSLREAVTENTDRLAKSLADVGFIRGQVERLCSALTSRAESADKRPGLWSNVEQAVQVAELYVRRAKDLVDTGAGGDDEVIARALSVNLGALCDELIDQVEELDELYASGAGTDESARPARDHDGPQSPNEAREPAC
jgi:hypothetical protein